MASLLMLLLFCDFLENRLQTSSLTLLRRMYSDFFAGNERTLLDFVRLGASLVAVMPIERSSQSHRQEADRLLRQQRQLMANRNEQHAQLGVFHYLAARVATRNIFWLRDIFLEFCSGNDSLLQEFVRRGSEAISVIPVDYQALRMSPPQSVPELRSSQMSSATPTNVMLDRRQNQQYLPVEDSCNGSSSSDDDTEINNMNELMAVASLPPSSENLRTCILGVLGHLEAQEPWTKVFSPDTLPPPFSRAKYPKLAAELKTFWAKHAHAVWERRFWGRLKGNLHELRKSRQAAARKAFETLMTHVFEELGATFFTNLDRHRKPHRGWWYVETAQDLVLIAQRTDVASCLNYMESQALERFPIIPGGWIDSKKSNNGKSRSMWSARSSMAPILSEICAAAARTKQSKKTSKK